MNWDYLTAALLFAAAYFQTLAFMYGKCNRYNLEAAAAYMAGRRQAGDHFSETALKWRHRAERLEFWK